MVFLSVATSQSFSQYKDDLVIDTAHIRCIYNLTWQPRPDRSEFKREDRVLLFIGENIRSSMAENIFLRDSIIRNVEPSILWNDLSVIPETFMRFRTYRNYPTGKISTIDYIYTDVYEYDEPLSAMQWTLHPDTATIAGYLCQKATTDLGSRDWVAWFAPDIAIPEGPYKFHGLPGLIVKIEDTQQHYVFELISVNHQQVPTLIYFPSRSFIATSKKNFLRTQNRFSQNPSSYIIEDQHGILSDDPATQRQIIRSLSRQNNYIELFEP